MKEFRINWVIELDAETHEDAAKQALEIQRDPRSSATMFMVYEKFKHKRCGTGISVEADPVEDES